MKYIHYGHDRFDPQLFRKIRNRPYWEKPSGGLWASPVDAVWGWKQWCEAEEFRGFNGASSFRFSLSDTANVYDIRIVEDLYRLPEAKMPDPMNAKMLEGMHYLIDFEECAKIGIDAIELYWSDSGPRCFGEGLKYMMSMWDCDSILIMNPGIIIPE